MTKIFASINDTAVLNFTQYYLKMDAELQKFNTVNMECKNLCLATKKTFKRIQLKQQRIPFTVSSKMNIDKQNYISIFENTGDHIKSLEKVCRNYNKDNKEILTKNYILCYLTNLSNFVPSKADSLRVIVMIQKNAEVTGSKKSKATKHSDNLSSKHRSKSCSSQDAELPESFSSDSEDKEMLGPDETNLKTVVKIKRHKNKDGTMTENKEVITIKTKTTNSKIANTDKSKINKENYCLTSPSVSTILTVDPNVPATPDVDPYVSTTPAMEWSGVLQSLKKPCHVYLPSTKKDYGSSEFCSLTSQITQAERELDTNEQNSSKLFKYPSQRKQKFIKIIKDPSNFEQYPVKSLNCINQLTSTSGLNDISSTVKGVTMKNKEGKKEKMFCLKCQKLIDSPETSPICLKCCAKKALLQNSSQCSICKEKFSKMGPVCIIKGVELRKMSSDSTSIQSSRSKESQNYEIKVNGTEGNKCTQCALKKNEIESVIRKVIKELCEGLPSEIYLKEPKNRRSLKEYKTDNAEFPYNKTSSKTYEIDSNIHSTSEYKKIAPIEQSFTDCQGIKIDDLIELRKSSTGLCMKPSISRPSTGSIKNCSINDVNLLYTLSSSNTSEKESGAATTKTCQKQFCEKKTNIYIKINRKFMNDKYPTCVERKFSFQNNFVDKEKKKKKISPVSNCLSFEKPVPKQPLTDIYDSAKLEVNDITSSECFICSKRAKTKLSSESICIMCDAKLTIAKLFSDLAMIKNKGASSCKICGNTDNKPKISGSCHIQFKNVMMATETQTSASLSNLGKDIPQNEDSSSVPNVHDQESSCPEAQQTNTSPKSAEKVSLVNTLDKSTCCTQDASTQTPRSAKFDVRKQCNIVRTPVCECIPHLSIRSKDMCYCCCQCRSDAYMTLPRICG